MLARLPVSSLRSDGSTDGERDREGYRGVRKLLLPFVLCCTHAPRSRTKWRADARRDGRVTATDWAMPAEREPGSKRHDSSVFIEIDH